MSYYSNNKTYFSALLCLIYVLFPILSTDYSILKPFFLVMSYYFAPLCLVMSYYVLLIICLLIKWLPSYRTVNYEMRWGMPLARPYGTRRREYWADFAESRRAVDSAESHRVPSIETRYTIEARHCFSPPVPNSTFGRAENYAVSCKRYAE